MKNLIYIALGTLFSITLIKVEAISWFRIQEMFYFDSFHMYGVLFSAILTVLIGLKILKTVDGILLEKKPLRLMPNLIGGVFFGLGWGITGACSGPIFALLGLNVWPILLVLIGALIGTLVYGFVQNSLPGNSK